MRRFAQDVSCIIGEDSREDTSWGWKFKVTELGRLKSTGSRQGVWINISPSQKLLLRSRATSVSALFFMNVSSPSAPAMLPFQRPEQANVYVELPILILVWLSVESKNQKPNIPVIQSLRCHLSQWDVALLQNFSVWVRKAALLQFLYAAGKIHPENKSLLVWNGFPVYCDNFFVWFLSSWLSKAYFFKIQCGKLYLLWM